MAESVRWYELVLPRTTKGCADAHVMVKGDRLRVFFMSEKARKVSPEAMRALKWALISGRGGQRFPWRKVPKKRSFTLEVLYSATPAAQVERQRLAVAASG